jgi:hypothetical protein
MRGHSLRATAAALLCGIAVLAASPAGAADSYKGTITADAQKAAFNHGLAWIDAKRRVSVGLYKTEPNAKEQARALGNSGEIFGVFDAPNVTVELSFKDGATRAEAGSFESCHIRFSRFDAGLFDWNAFSKQCGVVALSGELTPGSVVQGTLKGSAEAYPRPDGTRPQYTWDMDFTATVRSKP